ncbi:MAG: fibronectin type III domain-containing protein [Steroidobacteraceae bacterium]|nr:fibronectin type III domain-containing protein [Steroidobacteraceae bacterium]
MQAGTPYSFTPQASDPDGDALTFSIVNKPDWATFNTTTGQLTGTPTAASAGNFPGVTIRVSDGKETAELAPFAIFVNTIPSAIGSATISWLPPTTRSDGSALTNLAGYRIRYGTALGNYPSVVAIDNPSVTSYVVERLSGGMTYYFVVTAIDSAGVESDYSTPASKKID